MADPKSLRKQANCRWPDRLALHRSACPSSLSLPFIAQPALHRSAEWADAIQSEPLRDRTRETLYARWVEKDSEAAADWKDGWE